MAFFFFTLTAALFLKNITCFLAWLRRHCMKVFHYLAERLKDTPLFDTCSDQLVTGGKDCNEGRIIHTNMPGPVVQ